MNETVSQTFQHIMGISDYNVAAVAYIILASIILLLFYSITRLIKDPYGLMLWLLAGSFMLAPTFTQGEEPKLAPAVIGVLFAVLSKQTTEIYASLVPIFWTIGLVFALVFLYRFFRYRVFGSAK